MKKTSIEQIEIRASIKLFDFLQERQNNRFTKLQAYCYLLNKAIVQYVPQNRKKSTLPTIKEGQFVTTISELAEEWNWHRATVRSFLDRLLSLGQLEKTPLIKSVMITIRSAAPNAEAQVVGIHLFEPITKYMMYSWASGDSDRHVAALVCGQISKCAMMLFKEQMRDPTPEMVSEAEDELTRTIIGFAVSSAIASKSSIVDTVELECAVFSVFTEVLNKNWKALFLFLEELPKIVLQGQSASFKLNSDNSAKAFQSVCSIYKSILENGTERAIGKQQALSPIVE